MAFIDLMKEKARSNKKTIVLPEAEDKRTLVAVEKIMEEGTANLILLGNADKIAADAKEFGANIEGAAIVDPANDVNFNKYAETLYELRKSKGMTLEKAQETITKDLIAYGIMMVKLGDADGLVAGACRSTADTLRPALQILKTAPGTELVSGFFIMDVPNCEFGENGTFLFADCGLNQDPNAAELAAIANSSAASFKALTGNEAKIAMLSHSTMGSAKHALVDKVAEATKIAKEKYPNIKVDGELQLDAAIVPSVGKQKNPNGAIQGDANVFIFPDLQAGNIAYKVAQRLGEADAIGPNLQGLAKAMNDLSRGCSAEDIVGTIAVTLLQSVAK
jgi:phosphate acetyltransferase